MQPAGKLVVKVFHLLDAKKVNDPGVFFLGFLDTPMLQAPAKHDEKIEPVLGDGHGCKDGSDLEQNSGLGWSSHNLAACQHKIVKPLVQLHDLWRLAVEKLRHGEPAAGVRLAAVGELATAPRAGPQRFGAGSSR